jgi:hypothetical protein
MNARVVIVQETMPEYRLPLLRALTVRAAELGIHVEVVHGIAPGPRGERLGTRDPSPFHVVRNRYLQAPGLRQGFVWQPVLRRCIASDLVVVEQANRALVNYLLLAGRRVGGPRVAFWGHGRNRQGDPGSLRERAKRSLAIAPSWWFAYTEGVAAYLEALGFPAARTTVIGNTIDVESLRQEIEQERSRFHEPAAQRCLFLGGLHRDKELGILFKAADRIANEIDGF